MSPKKNSNGISEPGYSFYAKPLGARYDCYLSDPVADAELYANWFSAIRNAQPQYEASIRINSRGGYTATALQFVRAMSETQSFNY